MLNPSISSQVFGFKAAMLVMLLLSVVASADEDSRRKKPKKKADAVESNEAQSQDSVRKRAKKPPETEAEVGDAQALPRRKNWMAKIETAAGSAKAALKRKLRRPETVSESPIDASPASANSSPRKKKSLGETPHDGVVTLRDQHLRKRGENGGTPANATVGAQPRTYRMRKSYDEFGKGYLGGFPSPANTTEESMDVEDNTPRTSKRHVPGYIPAASAGQYGSIPGETTGNYISPFAPLKVADASGYDSVSLNDYASQYIPVSVPLRVSGSSVYGSVSAADYSSQYIPVPEGRGSRRSP